MTRAGFCECGCGAPTRLARVTNSKRGHVAGEPVRFLVGHNNRTSPIVYVVDEKTGCWDWMLHKDQTGYARMYFRGRTRKASRAYWTMAFGEIPSGLHVLHKCDNRACVNPDHLFLGTNDDNMADMVAKGRQCRGSKNGVAKLTEEDVAIIRSRATTETYRSVAADFGVCAASICLIVQRKTWKHVGRQT